MFQLAKPIFIKDQNKTPNFLCGYYTSFEKPKGSVSMKITGRSFLRVFINGNFVHYGPARSPHNYLRVDQIDITDYLLDGVNHLAVELISYNITTNLFVTHESGIFVCEVLCNNQVLCASGKDFKGVILNQKNAKTEPIGFGRRVPVENYTLDSAYYDWKFGKAEFLEVQELNNGDQYLPRGVLNADFSLVDYVQFMTIYSKEPQKSQLPPRKWFESDDYGNDCARPSTVCVNERNTAFDGTLQTENGSYILSDLKKDAALDFEFSETFTGFVGIHFSSASPCVIDLVYNDILDENGNGLAYDDSTHKLSHLISNGGEHSFLSFEPHFVRHIQVIVRGCGSITIHKVFARRCQYQNLLGGSFSSSDRQLNEIWKGAYLTTITNTLDVFMDSPSRERGGWAGDSYWTGRAARMLMGDNLVEGAMLENFFLAPKTEVFKNGFPQAYPGGREQEQGFLFNWNLFLIYEFIDYYRRCANEDIKTRFQARIEAFMETVATFENDFSLLENPFGTIFIDWSPANNHDYNHPISIPTNAFYADLLEGLSSIYGKDDYHLKAEKIKQVLHEEYSKIAAEQYHPFTTYPFISDSYEVKDGKLTARGLISEAASYYLFFNNVLTEKNAPDLAKNLCDYFGLMPSKYRGTSHLSIAPSGIFFGQMMRFEMLSKIGRHDLIIPELKNLCGYMLDNGGGTYYETLSGKDSRNHGFGGHFGVVITRDILGLDMPNEVDKKITVAPHPSGLKWAKGSIKVENSTASVHWFLSDEEFYLTVSCPNGYELDITLPNEVCHFTHLSVNGNEIPFQKTIVIKQECTVRCTM